jgi:SAM-dependent methyltransferase
VSDVARLLADADARPVEGWDFSWLGERLRTAPLPWSFDDMVATHIQASPDHLDLETGGGEWLARLPVHALRTVATESWPPNVDVAGRRLRPLGITVVWTDAAPENVEQSEHEPRGRLPFPSGSFELVTNRHGTFVASEIARVLEPGGVFLTQQVGGDYHEFCDALGLQRPESRGGGQWNSDLAKSQVARAGLRVTDSAAALEETAFADVGALAWYLKAIPWVVPGFSVETHRAQLKRVQAEIDERGPLALRQPAFWLRAVKPG